MVILIWWQHRQLKTVETVKPASNRKEIKMYHHFVDVGSDLHQPNTEMDACPLLISCFGENDRYSVYGEEHCPNNLDLTLKYYDSAYLVEEDGVNRKAVGFISIHHQRASELTRTRISPAKDQHALIVYNVCVHPEYRGRGLGKRLVPEFVDAMIKHYKLESFAQSRGDNPDDPPPLIVALDVELDTPSSQEAFSIYARQGFIRWIQPCKSVAELDWRIVNDTRGKIHPLGQMLSADRGKYLREAYRLDPDNGSIIRTSLTRGPERDGQGRVKKDQPKDPRLVNHLCMYKYYADSYGQIAKDYLHLIQSV